MFLRVFLSLVNFASALFSENIFHRVYIETRSGGQDTVFLAKKTGAEVMYALQDNLDLFLADYDIFKPFFNIYLCLDKDTKVFQLLLQSLNERVTIFLKNPRTLASDLHVLLKHECREHTLIFSIKDDAFLQDIKKKVLAINSAYKVFVKSDLFSQSVIIALVE